MKLLVDIGNNFAKSCMLHADGRISEALSVRHHGVFSAALLDRLNQGVVRPEQVFVSNVAGAEVQEAFISAQCELWNSAPTFVRPQLSGYGITNAYLDPETLGVDRWLAMIAAAKRYEGLVCIVDCGTALTIDVIDAEGKHLGGVIAPGFQLMAMSLRDGTVALDIDVSENSEVSDLLGRSTQECIELGCLWSMVGLIERVVTELAQGLGSQVVCVVTGGDAWRISKFLAFETHHETALVLQGLAIVADGEQ